MGTLAHSLAISEPQTASFFVKALTLTRFRSYAYQRLVCDARPVVLTGPNGAGKTNVLESLSFLSPGRGLRGVKLSDVTHQNFSRPQEASQPWGVHALLSAEELPLEIGTALDVSDGLERRVVSVNGEVIRPQTRLSEHLSVVWLTPVMDRLFHEGAPTRRRFLDRLVYGLFKDHASRVNRYEQAMRERTRLLKMGGTDRTWVAALEHRMAEEGSAISAARLDFVGRLNGLRSRGLSRFPSPYLEVAGDLEGWLSEGPALEAEERFMKALEETRRRDGEVGGASIGPHKSDLRIYFNDKERGAEYCSTGEQKALLLSLIMAAARLHGRDGVGTPLLLLDEVVAHLDEGRRASLFEEILTLKMQAWMTGTDTELFDHLGERVQHFQIENAMIHPANYK